MKICGVKFKDTGKIYYFKNNDLDLKKNLTVIVDTEKGEQFAKVIETDIKNKLYIDESKMKSVIRISTKEDYNKYVKNLKLGKDALQFARDYIQKNGLEMRILDSNFTLDKKYLLINFVADDRVDFRELVKELAAKYKARIELHQIGVRDKSREVGGIGACGRPLCCSSFLSGMETISINMAKNQNIALNPSKINGACGRLLCCLAYEDEVYVENRKKLPKMNQMIDTPCGKGRVCSLDILNTKYTVDIDGDKKTYESNVK